MIIKKYKLYLESFKNEKNMWTIIPQSVKELHEMFKKHNKQLFVVGGAVRDFLNKQKPKDFDLTTDAFPDEVVSIIGNKWRTTVQGANFGVVVVYTEDEPKGMEIATFRSDDYSGKLGITRDPKVILGASIDKDAERRDITYNSLYYDLDKKEIIDLTGGVEDMLQGVTKMVGDSNLRIQEDPLRILRVFRFSCRYEFPIHEDTKLAIHKNKHLLSIISKERIWGISGDNTGEIYKAFKQAKNFSDYIRLLLEYNIFEEILPKLKINSLVSDSEFLVIYLANLLKENSSKNLLNELIQVNKFKTNLARSIVFLIDLLDLDTSNVFDLYKKKIVSKLEDKIILEWLVLNNKENTPIYKAFIKYKPSVNSQDLINLGYSGLELGKKIKELELENFKKLYD